MGEVCDSTCFILSKGTDQTSKKMGDSITITVFSNVECAHNYADYLTMFLRNPIHLNSSEASADHHQHISIRTMHPHNPYNYITKLI